MLRIKKQIQSYNNKLKKPIPLIHLIQYHEMMTESMCGLRFFPRICSNIIIIVKFIEEIHRRTNVTEKALRISKMKGRPYKRLQNRQRLNKI